VSAFSSARDVACRTLANSIMKRPACDGLTERIIKRGVPAAGIDMDNGVAASRLQAAYRGFRVRGDGIVALARSQSEARRAQARSDQTDAVEARLRQPEYRQVSRCCHGARVQDLAELDEKLQHLVGMNCLRDYCAGLRRDCLARVALGEANFAPRNVLISGNMGSGKKVHPRARAPPLSASVLLLTCSPLLHSHAPSHFSARVECPLATVGCRDCLCAAARPRRG